MDTYTYEIGSSLYINITNKCSNQCSFCVRETAKGIGENSLWLSKEPTAKEILDTIKNPQEYKEFVFCGFGEPLTRLDVVIEIAKRLRTYNIPIRLNTNGQANLVHHRNIVPELAGIIDIVSISLNADNSKTYQEICSSVFGEEAFDAVIDFTRKCKEFIPRVLLSVVGLPGVNIDKCRDLANELGVEFRLRHWSPNL